MTMRSSSLSGLAEQDIDEMLAGLRPIAARLRDARILVTGATGWFGTWLLDALVALDRAEHLRLRIVAVSRDPQRFAARHAALANASIVEWVEGDVCDRHLAVRGRLTHVIHAATEASAALNAASPGTMFDTIVGGTRNVLRIAADAGAQRALLTSSGAIYGVQPASVTHLTEDHVGAPDPLDVANAYAEGKRASEQIAAICHRERGLQTAIARCFAFVGPHMPLDAHFAIGNFIRDAIERDAIVIKGDGTPTRSYLYMTDLVVWLLTMMVEALPLRAYNVGSDEALSIVDLARRCADVARGSDRQVSVRVEARSRGGAPYVPSTVRARDELGLVRSVGLDDAIERTLRWASAQQVAGVVSESAVHGEAQ